MAKKRKKTKMGRPSKGPTINVTLRRSKELADRVAALQAKSERTRTEIIEGLLKAGLQVDRNV